MYIYIYLHVNDAYIVVRGGALSKETNNIVIISVYCARQPADIGINYLYILYVSMYGSAYDIVKPCYTPFTNK